jgi:hypothetical protein
MKKVLIDFDGSDASCDALALGEALAKREGNDIPRLAPTESPRIKTVSVWVPTASAM